jgi:hypothetical protein
MLEAQQDHLPKWGLVIRQISKHLRFCSHVTISPLGIVKTNNRKEKNAIIYFQGAIFASPPPFFFTLQGSTR